jgi:hypothetical protein
MNMPIVEAIGAGLAVTVQHNRRSLPVVNT